MKVYSGERLVRFYSFIMGRLWQQDTDTEYVRIDFTNAIDPSPSTGHRSLLKREADASPAQWLFLPALRRVRRASYRPAEPLLQSDYLFYDLTSIRAFDDYDYQFVEISEQTPVIAGKPRAALVP